MVAMKTQWPEYPVWLGNTTLSLIRVNEKELKLGDKDAAPFGAVRMLQAAVRHWGLTRKSQPADLLPKYGADGVYGAETVAAVKVFQRNNKDAFGAALSDDGIVGDKTLSALDRLVKPANAPVPPGPNPTPKLLTVTVDFVVFEDGGCLKDVEKMLTVANQVYNPHGIRVAEGDVIGPSARSRTIASRFIWKNRTYHLPDPKKWSSQVRPETASQVVPAHAEARDLARRANKKRPTAYLVAPFAAPETSKGATFTPRVHKIDAFLMLIVNDPRYKFDTFWHELGHVLLDSDHSDHHISRWEDRTGDDRWKDEKWLMSTPPEPDRRKDRLPAKALARMLETIRTKFE